MLLLGHEKTHRFKYRKAKKNLQLKKDEVSTRFYLGCSSVDLVAGTSVGAASLASSLEASD
jgi:hypothetical protein